LDGDSLRHGRYYPLGATYDGQGTNFALFSESAEGVDLCLFDDAGRETRLALPERTLRVWHGYAPGVRPGQRYAYRVHGPSDPARGLRFDATKLLVDPYARALEGKASPGSVPRSVVVDDRFDWEDDAPPGVPWNDTVVYELHVKGFTQLHPEVPEAHRGSFLGLGSDAAVQHLKRLGVTAVELLPVHEAMTEPMVAARGLTNYWGYNTLGFFAPDQRFAARGPELAGSPPLARQVREFKAMVKRLHRAGLEVILDVVYNHTCEGDHTGPTVSFRGIDNATYYRLVPEDLRLYQDFTGCGNTMNVAHPQTLKLIMDSLRYWVTEMHVDGFRFDLAAALGRDAHAVDRRASFFDIIHQDPTLSRIKLIAEPWDVGADGYQAGNFPLLWTEWNGRFRDTVRRFWLGKKEREKQIGDLGYRLTGSSDLFGDDGRHPYASINFVVAHDGFTLKDLVSYEKKHNEANGEDNRDGWDDNVSDSGGVEGETKDPAVLALRRKLEKNLLATLVLSQGVPMLSMGDEMGRTQRGNNNAYCQDNPLSWMDWSSPDVDMLELARRALAIRREHASFRRREFFTGEAGRDGLKDIAWYRPDGDEMTLADWERPDRAAIGLLLATGERFLLLLNADDKAVDFVLPPRAYAASWEPALETGSGSVQIFERGGRMAARIEARSFVLMRGRRVA
jgi:glycogen operon protein